MKNKIPSLWLVFLLLISTPIIWLIVWFLLAWAAHLTGVPFPSMGDASGFLSTLASIMGAIFTVGGLVIALVAVLTQIQLTDRIKMEVDKAKQEVEDTFNTVIREEYEKRIQGQVEGMIAYSQATSTGDWRKAEELVREALHKYPELQGARSFLGLRLSNNVQEHFSNLLFARVPNSFATALHSTQARTAPPRIEAIQWLEDALKHQDDPEGRVSADLALMYAFNEAYEKMIEAIQEGYHVNPDLYKYLQSPVHLMMLIYACGNNLSRIQKLMELVKLPAPTEKDILDLLNQPKKSIGDQYVDWYAVDIQPGQNTKLPAVIRIFRPWGTEVSKQTYANIITPSKQMYTIPGTDPSRDPSQGVATLPVDDILKDLFSKFLFICLA